MPQRLLAIEDEAFLGLSSVEEMTVPDGVQTIGERAFADSSLEYVKLPESLSFIADDAFNGCTDLILEVSKNSYAERWCRKNDMAYVYPCIR